MPTTTTADDYEFLSTNPVSYGPLYQFRNEAWLPSPSTCSERTLLMPTITIADGPVKDAYCVDCRARLSAEMQQRHQTKCETCLCDGLWAKYGEDAVAWAGGGELPEWLLDSWAEYVLSGGPFGRGVRSRKRD